MRNRQRQKAVFFILVGLAAIMAILFSVPDPWKTILLALGPLAIAALVMFPARGERKAVFFALVFTAGAVTLLYLSRDLLLKQVVGATLLPTATQIDTTPPPTSPTGATTSHVTPTPILTVSPGSQSLIAFVRDGSIWVTDANGYREQRLTGDRIKAGAPAWAPDGERLAYAVEENGTWQIWTMWIDTRFNSESAVRKRITEDGGYWPTWSPDGSRIAYQSKFQAPGDVMVISAGSGFPRQLTDDPAYDGQPAWSPDGQYIAFASARTDTVQIWLMKANGSSPRQLTTGSNPCQHPAWSSDGRYLAYEVLPSGSGAMADIYVADVRSGKSWRLGQGSFPAWSPDGKWLACKIGGTAGGLWLLSADGSGAEQLLSGKLYHFAWRW